MHKQNPYATRRPDFAVLAQADPRLAPFVTVGPHGPSIDFHDARALRALSTALLRVDFDLDVELRPDRLCPTIANRLDYVLTCLDLTAHAPPGPLCALDIGTGHVAIYPLLLHRLRPDALCVGTELDETSLSHARRVCELDNWIAPNLISLIEAPADGSILGRLSSRARWSFTMCNPPFFSSAEEAAASREMKEGAVPAAPTAASNEEITRGGEEAFIGQMIDESVRFKDKVSWFTSLVGRYSSLEPLVRQVRKLTDNYAVIILRQAKTTRWVLAWSFGQYRLPESITHPEVVQPNTSFERMLPPSNTFKLEPFPPQTAGQLRSSVHRVLADIGLLPRVVGEEITLAPESNTWSRAARRAASRAAIGVSASTNGTNGVHGRNGSAGGNGFQPFVAPETSSGDGVGDGDGDVDMASAPSSAATSSIGAEDAAAMDTEGTDGTETPRPEPIFRATLHFDPLSEFAAFTNGLNGLNGLNGEAHTHNGSTNDASINGITVIDGQHYALRLEFTYGSDWPAVDAFWKFLVNKAGLLAQRQGKRGRRSDSSSMSGTAEEDGMNGVGGIGLDANGHSHIHGHGYGQGQGRDKRRDAYANPYIEGMRRHRGGSASGGGRGGGGGRSRGRGRRPPGDGGSDNGWTLRT